MIFICGLQVPTGDGWVGCETGIATFTLHYNSETQTVDGNERNAVISGLAPCTPYIFKMTADNADHSGPLSDAVEKSTEIAGKDSINFEGRKYTMYY